MLGTYAVSVSEVILFLNDPAPTETYTLTLHDALPIGSVPSLSSALTLSQLLSTVAGKGPSPTTYREQTGGTLTLLHTHTHTLLHTHTHTLLHTHSHSYTNPHTFLHTHTPPFTRCHINMLLHTHTH